MKCDGDNLAAGGFNPSEDFAVTHVLNTQSRSERVLIETGMMRFWGDWPGLFIRGDDAIGHVNSIRAVLDFAEKSLTRA